MQRFPALSNDCRAAGRCFPFLITDWGPFPGHLSPGHTGAATGHCRRFWRRPFLRAVRAEIRGITMRQLGEIPGQEVPERRNYL